MKVRLDDCSDKGTMSAWCIEQAIKNAVDNPSTSHLVVLNKFGVTRAYDAIRQIYPKIKAHWPADICCLSNGSQIRLITTHQFLKENNNHDPNLKCALYFPEELEKFEYKISWRDKRFTDMFVRVFSQPMCQAQVKLPIVIDCDFKEFLSLMRILFFPNIFFTISDRMNYLCRTSSELFKVRMEGKECQICEKSSYVGCEKNCWLLGKTIIVGNNCPAYTELYLEALRQQGGNFSLISGTMQKQ